MGGVGGLALLILIVWLIMCVRLFWWLGLVLMLLTGAVGARLVTMTSTTSKENGLCPSSVNGTPEEIWL